MRFESAAFKLLQHEMTLIVDPGDKEPPRASRPLRTSLGMASLQLINVLELAEMLALLNLHIGVLKHTCQHCLVTARCMPPPCI